MSDYAQSHHRCRRHPGRPRRRRAAWPPASPRSCSTSRPSPRSTCAAARPARAKPTCSTRHRRSSASTPSRSSGGSAFGLDAASGVQAWLREQGRGFAIARCRACRSCRGAIAVRPAQRRRQGLGPLPALSRARLCGGSGRRRRISRSAPPGAGFGATTVNLKGGLGSASAVTRDGHHRRRAGRGQRLRQRHCRQTARSSGRRRSSVDGEFGGLRLAAAVPAEALDPVAKGAPGENTTHRDRRDRRDADQGAGQAARGDGAGRARARDLSGPHAARRRHRVCRRDRPCGRSSRSAVNELDRNWARIAANVLGPRGRAAAVYRGAHRRCRAASAELARSPRRAQLARHRSPRATCLTSRAWPRTARAA